MYHRRVTNYFTDIETFNQKLLSQSEADWNRGHYKKLQTIGVLFEEDRKDLLQLLTKFFNACRYERLKTDGYGKFCLEGKHWYSSAPEMAEKELMGRPRRSGMLCNVRPFLTFSKLSGDADLVLKMWARPLHK